MAKNPVNVKITNKKETEKLFKTDFPNFTRFAVANTASRVVFSGLQKSETQMKKDFKIRTNYVVGKTPGKGALKFTRGIPHHDIDKITASWGAPEKQGRRDYSLLEDLEDGFINKGPVPAENARISKAQKKRIKRKNYFKGMTIAKISNFGSTRAISAAGKVRHMLKTAFKNKFGLPGSNQFFHLKDNEYAPRWEEGFFQFSRNNPPGSKFAYPNIRRIFYSGKNANKKRRATHWMRISKNKITQTEIEKIYAEEAKKSFTKQIQKR